MAESLSYQKSGKDQVPGGVTTSSSNHAFIALDALRGIAALCVGLFHYSRFYRGSGSANAENLTLSLFPDAYLAVDFFFLLSGFVIAHAYERRLLSGMTFREFMLRRFIRLYPLYLVGLMLPVLWLVIELAMGLPHATRSELFKGFFFEAFFLPAFNSASSGGDATLFLLNGPAWSLFLEMIINAVYAASSRKLTILLLGITALAAAIALVVLSFHFGTMDIGAQWKNYAGGFARVFWSFPAGIILYRIFGRLKKRALPEWALLLIAAVLILDFYQDSTLWLDLFSAFLLFPLLVFCGAYVKLNAASARIAGVLGAVSYAVYILHIPLRDGFHLIDTILHIDEGRHFLLNCFIWLGLASVIAWLMDRFYDIPVRRWLTKRFLSPK